jgi:23S rRNA G2445 N2-methylase RlmL
VWRIAGDVATRRPDLVNDPVDSTWQVHVSEDGAQVRVSLEPRKLEDPRFAYRVADIPASSHPTVAAALARLAVIHSAHPADDVVWDPFVGSGLELCERARLAPVRRLVGTDVSPEALTAARANLDSAGVEAELSIADASAHAPSGTTVIVTNPPMGKRLLRGRAHALVEEMVGRAARILPPGGLLCWISPVPGQTRARAADSGLRVVEASPIEMGGFASEIQVFRREETRSPRTRGKRPAGAAKRPEGGSRKSPKGTSKKSSKPAKTTPTPVRKRATEAPRRGRTRPAPRRT